MFIAFKDINMNSHFSVSVNNIILFKCKVMKITVLRDIEIIYNISC